MSLLASGLSHIGQKRKSNQDSIYYNITAKLLVVADGMGGHNGGDIASSVAVKTLPEQFLNLANNQDFLNKPAERLRASVKFANQSIYEMSQKDPLLKGMGTTIVAIHFHEGELFLANVGDSRAYLINHHRLFQLSRDHSLIQEKINLGIYTRDQAAKDPHKNVLIRSVGFDPSVEVDIYTYKVAKGDLFLICSDGLYGLVSESDMLKVINHEIPSPLNATQDNLNQLVAKLIALANHNGGTDNISVIVALAQ